MKSKTFLRTTATAFTRFAGNSCTFGGTGTGRQKRTKVEAPWALLEETAARQIGSMMKEKLSVLR
jgi:hypothetical protein